MPRSSKRFVSFRFPIKPLYEFPFSPIHATILLYQILRIIYDEEHKAWRLSVHSFLNCPVTSSLSGQKAFLSTTFSNNLRLHSFVDVRDQISHPYKTTGNIIILLTLNLGGFTEQTGRQKILDRLLIDGATGGNWKKFKRLFSLKK